MRVLQFRGEGFACSSVHAACWPAQNDEWFWQSGTLEVAIHDADFDGFRILPDSFGQPFAKGRGEGNDFQGHMIHVTLLHDGGAGKSILLGEQLGVYMCPAWCVTESYIGAKESFIVGILGAYDHRSRACQLRLNGKKRYVLQFENIFQSSSRIAQQAQIIGITPSFICSV